MECAQFSNMENLPLESMAGFLGSHIGKLRLVVFREDDRNNRRLLFDSDSFGNYQNDSAPPHRAQPDSKMLAEMVFGSTPTVCNVESIKLHQFRNPTRIMFTKIFSAHQSAASGVVSLQRLHFDDVLPQRIASSGSRRSSESSEDCESLPAFPRFRRQRIGIAVLFTVGDESQSESEPLISRRIQYLCSQSPTIFNAIKDELQDVVSSAYCARTNIVEIMKLAWHRFLLCLKSMCEATCRAHHMLKYFKIVWSVGSISSDSLVNRFMNTLSVLGTKYDTKQTNFFISTIITSVLGLRRIGFAGSATKKIPDIVLKCSDGKLLIQLVEIVGYFLKFVTSDFDRLSVKPVPVPLMRSLSSRTASKTTGALASLWGMVRSRKSFRQSSFDDKSVNSSPSRRWGSDRFLSCSTSSPIICRDVPSILVKESDFEEENGQQADRCDRNELDENTALSSSVPSSSSTANFLNAAAGSSEDDEALAAFFGDVEEIPLPARSPMSEGLMNLIEDALEPLCGNLDVHHNFANEGITNGRPLDIAISLCEFTDMGTAEAAQEALVVDAAAWKVYQTCTGEVSSQLANNNWTVCFPSALITEMLENVRTFSAQDFDANFCLMYVEDEIGNLFSKTEALARLIGESSELRSEFCTKVMRCDMADLSFLLK